MERGPEAKLCIIRNFRLVRVWQLDSSLISLLLLGDHCWLVISTIIPQMGHNPHFMGKRTGAPKKLNQFGQNRTAGPWQSPGEFEPFFPSPVLSLISEGFCFVETRFYFSNIKAIPDYDRKNVKQEEECQGAPGGHPVYVRSLPVSFHLTP